MHVHLEYDSQGFVSFIGQDSLYQSKVTLLDSLTQELGWHREREDVVAHVGGGELQERRVPYGLGDLLGECGRS
ncbi:MAG: hypothetical protein M5U19_00935 [Microthrixaceae bacterium]|nr:hypothetical protein [Microthrixaceae bacterium]